MADLAGADELAELMPRTVGGRRLSAAAFSSDALKQYQAAVRAQRQARRPAPAGGAGSALTRSATQPQALAPLNEEPLGESALARLLRPGGSGRPAATTARSFVLKPWCAGDRRRGAGGGLANALECTP